MEEIRCPACLHYRDTPNHELGCLPFHNTKDRTCKARSWNSPVDLEEFCGRCVS